MTSNPSARWKDLIPEAKVYVQFLSLYPTNRLWFFTSHIKQAYADKLVKQEKPIVQEVGARLREALAKDIGRGVPVSLVLEMHSKARKECRPHIHGFILLDDGSETEALRLALHHSCWQGVGGANKDHSAVKIEKVYGKQEKLPAYICKNTDLTKCKGQVPFFSSQSMTSFARGVWENIRRPISALS